MRTDLAAIVLGTILLFPSAALAQRFPFERSFDVDDEATLDVSTIRGKIDVSVGESSRVVVTGTVTVRVGLDVPANAVELARGVAAQPPVERDGNTIRLRPPVDRAQQRAVTVAYEIKVPRNTEVVTVSDSGETTIRGVAGAVAVRTQSGAIELNQLGSNATVTTGSGHVTADAVSGALDVTTSSSAFAGRSLSGTVKVRTTSGAVDVGLSGPGAVDIETGSSGIRVTGMRAALNASTRSGRVVVEGAPTGTWDVSTGSGSVEMSMATADVAIDATTGSGSVSLVGADVDGTVSKKRIAGGIGDGGPQIRIRSRSGSIRLKVASPARR